LLTAAKNLEERVAPLATLYEDAMKQNQALLNELQQLKSASAAYMTKASRAKEIAGLHRDEELRLRERARSYVTIIKQKDLAIERLEMELNERDKRVRALFVLTELSFIFIIHHNSGNPIEDEAESFGTVTKARIQQDVSRSRRFSAD
jgi:hypothetical protein